MYAAETHSILVRVDPCFLPQESDPGAHQYLWAYTIEIENRSRETVQLLSRYWRIADATGRIQEVEGPGVIGQQPTLNPGESFRYTSACPLNTPSGMMVGAYEMVRTHTGERFSIAIPAFALDSPDETRRVN
ncbi:MAG: Co2+/Mg2+ efflux protein ApaG [Hyphomonadaceae bacterium]